MPAVSGDFVRVAEWQRVREFAAAAAGRGVPAALAVEGEAGAGKSKLWRAAVAAAARAGCRVLRTEPSASEADTPFAGLSDLLAAVLPEVADGIPVPQREALEVALLARPADGKPPATHAIGRGVLAALSALADAGPVLLAIDDAQWLDEGSLDALEFALRRIAGGIAEPPLVPAWALSLLLAVRTDAPADPLTVGSPPPSHGWRGLLTGFAAAEEITLAPLDAVQVQNLLPPGATAGQARLVVDQSRGNPFWAGEIWASMASAPAVPAPGDSQAPPVPPLARAALAGRLERSLPADAAEALTVVAAAGRITVTDAVAAMDHLADPAGALDAAVLSGVVAETEGRLAAAHPLIGAAAVNAVPPGRRARVYRRLAEISASPERRAQFAAAAGAGPDPGVAAALDAAAEAAHARAAAAAAGKFAAQAVEFTPSDDTGALVRRRIRAGELLHRASDLNGSFMQLASLDIDALPTADAERALPLLADLTDMLHGPADVTAMITRALRAPRQDDRRHALLLSLASDNGYGIPGGRRAAAIEAIRCAEEAAPHANLALRRALLNLTVAKATTAEGLDAGLLERAEQVERVVTGIPLRETVDIYRGTWCRYADDLGTSRSALRRSLARAQEAGEDFAQWMFLYYLAVTEELAGDYAAAAAALEAADRLAAWYDDWPDSPWLMNPRCELLIAAGKLDEALRIADEHLPDDASQPFPVRFMGACVRGKVSWWTGDAAGCVRHLELAARYCDEFGWTEPGVRSRVDHLLAEAYVATGQPDQAARISAWLHDLGTRLSRPALVGDACRIDALAAAAAGDLDAAASLASQAVTAHEQSPLRTELAYSLLVLGRIERRRKARSQSRAALARARDIARGIGHQLLLTEIAGELPRAAVPRPSTTLTEAEQRVAQEIAKGVTSREAAAELFISVRTVETHVASIYRKLGIRGRSELRRVLSQQNPAGD
jgi:DNA-binding CsgD family transcriptional regulator